MKVKGKKRLKFTGFFLIIVIALLISATVGKISFSNSSDWMPTAEYALSSSILPDFVRSVEPASGEVIRNGDDVCISILPGGIDYEWSVADAADNTIVLVDGRRIYAYSLSITAALLDTRSGKSSGLYIVCVTRSFTKGIHLFEIILSPENIPSQSYAWAYYVE